MTRLRIKCTDNLGNVSYVFTRDNGTIACALSNGMAASLSYAGFHNDPQGAAFALEGCADSKELAAAAKELGSWRYSYEVVGS